MNIQFSKEDFKRYIDQANKEDVYLGDLIRRLLDEYLDEENTPKMTEEECKNVLEKYRARMHEGYKAVMGITD